MDEAGFFNDVKDDSFSVPVGQWTLSEQNR